MRLQLFVAPAIALVALAALPAVGQQPVKTKTAAKTWTPPKTPWGDPDLQGVWPGNMGVPMQRAKAMGTRTELTDEEFAQREAAAKRNGAADSIEFAPKDQRIGIGPPSYWTERGKPTRQASLVVDPPDGRIPPVTPEAKAIQAKTPAEWFAV